MPGHIAEAGNVGWRTPGNIVGTVRAFFRDEIDMDPCAATQGEGKLARENLVLPEDGLAVDWDGRVYVNPPFGTSYVRDNECLTPKQWRERGSPHPEWRKQTIGQWVRKAEESQRINDCEVIMLIPAAVDTKWWQETILPCAAGICFIRGRVRFHGAPGPAPMACALVYFGDKGRLFRKFFGPTAEHDGLGHCAWIP